MAWVVDAVDADDGSDDDDGDEGGDDDINGNINVSNHAVQLRQGRRRE